MVQKLCLADSSLPKDATRTRRPTDIIGEESAHYREGNVVFSSSTREQVAYVLPFPLMLGLL